MKLSALAPVFLLSLGTLTACGGGSETSPDPTPTPDTTAPVITLNGDSALTHSAGFVYADAGATANDATDGSVDVTMTGAVDSDVVSSYTLTYSASDKAGNNSSTTRTVNVVDTTAPVISLEGDSEVTHSAGTDYIDAGATATDSVDGDVEVTTTGSVDSTTVGSYTLTYTATDAAGNSSIETRTVVVADDVAPEIVLNGVSPFVQKAGVAYGDLGVVVTDNIDETSDIVITITGEVDADKVASYTITFTATDSAGNQSSITRIVNVVDLTPPVITLNGAAEITLSNGAAYLEEEATATDNIDPEVTVTITGDVLTAAGTYTVTYTAEDKAENTTTKTRTVIVEADIAPEGFVIAAKDNVFLNTAVESEKLNVTGVNTEITVSIVGGEYSIDDAEYTAVEGTITAGQKIKVKVTSANTLDAESETTLTLGSLSETFTVTTRSAEPSGIFKGTGTVNTDVASVNLMVKGMVYQERFIFFNEAENVLYDGTITGYDGTNFTASVDVYKTGVIDSTVAATGTISNQAAIDFTMTGTGYGKGTIRGTYFTDGGGDAYYDRDATQARYTTASDDAWYDSDGANTQFQNHALIVRGHVDEGLFAGETAGAHNCGYNGTKNIPDNANNLYQMSFDVTQLGFSTNCDQIDTGFTGMMTLVDGGGVRFTDGTMWFASTNGTYATFGTPFYYESP